MALLDIVLVYSPAPRIVREWRLALPPRSSVGQAIEASGILNEFPDLASDRLIAGVWGRQASLRRVLVAHDRVEIYRALRVDPKVARRERFNSQGVKKSGLFARKRAGAKAGY